MGTVTTSMTPGMMAYRALETVAAEKKMPSTHAEDLTKWDRSVVEGLGDGECFAWALYESGTHLITPDRVFITNGREGPASQYVQCIERVWRGIVMSWYWWDGVRLLRVKADRVKGLLDEVTG